MEIRSSADFVRMTRAVLAAAGFARHEEGGTVWWDSGEEERATVVLVHGVNDQAGSWFRVAPQLARTHRVIIPDLAGHGESGPSEGPLPLSMIVDEVEHLLTDVPVTLIGNSLGGWIALLYTLRHPKRVAHLVLESSGGLSLPFASPVVATNREEAVAVLRAVHGLRFEPPDWAIDALIERAGDSPILRIAEVEEHYLDGRLREVRVPTTIVWGAEDGVLPLWYAEELRRGIEGATLHVIDDAAHIPHLQQPERFLACLTAIF